MMSKVTKIEQFIYGRLIDSQAEKASSYMVLGKTAGLDDEVCRRIFKTTAVGSPSEVTTVAENISCFSEIQMPNTATTYTALVKMKRTEAGGGKPYCQWHYILVPYHEFVALRGHYHRIFDQFSKLETFTKPVGFAPLLMPPRPHPIQREAAHVTRLVQVYSLQLALDVMQTVLRNIPIVITDEDVPTDVVLDFVKGISFMLPPACRPWLSFSITVPDPNRVPAQILAHIQQPLTQEHATLSLRHKTISTSSSNNQSNTEYMAWLRRYLDLKFTWVDILHRTSGIKGELSGRGGRDVQLAEFIYRNQLELTMLEVALGKRGIADLLDLLDDLHEETHSRELVVYLAAAIAYCCQENIPLIRTHSYFDTVTDKDAQKILEMAQERLDELNPNPERTFANLYDALLQLSADEERLFNVYLELLASQVEKMDGVDLSGPLIHDILKHDLPIDHLKRILYHPVLSEYMKVHQVATWFQLQRILFRPSANHKKVPLTALLPSSADESPELFLQAFTFVLQHGIPDVIEKGHFAYLNKVLHHDLPIRGRLLETMVANFEDIVFVGRDLLGDIALQMRHEVLLKLYIQVCTRRPELIVALFEKADEEMHPMIAQATSLALRDQLSDHAHRLRLQANILTKVGWKLSLQDLILETIQTVKQVYSEVADDFIRSYSEEFLAFLKVYHDHNRVPDQAYAPIDNVWHTAIELASYKGSPTLSSAWISFSERAAEMWRIPSKKYLRLVT
ncbi:MAG TPA: hypothetical protein VLL52_24145, partial [Anaerolineae bacterium]|nr:hypothetical protein [Anaerolineae bacterium]